MEIVYRLSADTIFQSFDFSIKRMNEQNNYNYYMKIHLKQVQFWC